ncbi:hypothetical protein [Fusibacter tunisiensis]|uniref:Disulfide oxidoreductase YuzD n=1 Tax=Fusibacter tunisiensis TaxID=1008308 RepID=A0ABS2MTL6_9FIRM|nr:hypothetical protein [Fusibacter tunisiensis]MBM7562685.1 disulfide oxidoreductase YuzD [Fusibacter tunisiensis]
MASIIDVLTQKYPEADIGFILDKKIMTENVFESEQSRYFESYVSEDYVSDRHVFESIVVSETNPKLYQDSEFLDQLKAIAGDYLKNKTSFSTDISYKG